MRISDSLKITCGSIIVYYVMAACSGSSGTTIGGTDNSSSGGPGGGSGASSSSGSSSSGGNGSGSGSSGGGSNSGGFNGGSSGGKGSSSGPVPDANADQTQSGSRLKAEYYVGGDGSKQWDYSFQDSARGNEHCSFLNAADGTIRCLPSGITAGIFFADTSCSVSLAYAVSACSNTPTYATSAVATSACPAKYEYHLYPVTAKYTGTVYTGSPGSCTAYTSFPYAAYAIGSEIAPSDFVQASLQTE